MSKTPIPFRYRSMYRWFSTYWWTEFWHDVTSGFWRDCYTLYHRARYGWAPRDVWNLDNYLDKVLAETLRHLADTTHGTPSGYPHLTNPPLDDDGMPITNHAQWVADLRRWADAFDADEWEFEVTDETKIGEMWHQRALEVRQGKLQALTELTPWWGSLWD